MLNIIPWYLNTSIVAKASISFVHSPNTLQIDHIALVVPIVVDHPHTVAPNNGLVI